MSTAERMATDRVSPKRDAIVHAAAEVFLESGIAAASMDEIARRAQVSKATVYSHFESKHALFGAIVDSRCHALAPSVDMRWTELPPATALTQVGRAFLDVMFMPGSLPLYRIVLAEAPRFPELGRVFYETGPKVICASLADYLAARTRDGVLAIEDAAFGAEQFFNLVIGMSDMLALLGIKPEAPTNQERDAMVARAVRVFLHGTMPARAGA